MRASEAQAEKAAAESTGHQDAAASLRQDLQRELDHVAELQRQVTRSRFQKVIIIFLKPHLRFRIGLCGLLL